MTEKTTALIGLLDKNCQSFVQSAFACMDIAEQEIEKAKARHPERVKALHDAFRYLQPSVELVECHEELYRAHCRELLERVAQGHKKKALSLGTDAELLIAFREMCLKSPLITDAACLYAKVFERVFGCLPFKGRPLYETWDGATDEIESMMRRKLSRNRDCWD